jgi:glutathione S-transferase
MKLLHSPTSPFVRTVLIAARELGLADAIELETVTVTPTAENAGVASANPLTKVPTLVLDDGSALFDSRVIVAYLDTLTDRALCPAQGPGRWRVLTELAQANGLMEAALLARYETFLRPEPLRWADWTAGQMGKVRRALDAFEGSERRAGDDLTIADIGLACGLGYLDFRFAELGWREGRPNLAAFHAAFAARASYKATDPNS